MEFITIVIGQFRGEVIMPETEWNRFQMAVTAVLTNYLGDGRWLEYYYGKTYWAERMEPCLSVTLMGAPVANVPSVKVALARIAEEFEQDAISVRYGTAELA